MGFGRAFTTGFQQGVTSRQEAQRAEAAEQARQDQLGFQRQAAELAERREERQAAAQAEQLRQSRTAFAEQQRVINRQREFEEAATEALKPGGNIQDVLQQFPDKAQNLLALQQTQQQIQNLQVGGVDVRRAAGQGFNALARGDKEGAKAIVRANKTIIEGAGDPSFTVDRMIEIIDTDPGQAAQMMQGLYTLSGGDSNDLLGVKGKLTSFQAAQVAQKQQEIAIKQAKEEREAKAAERDAAKDELTRERTEKEIQVLDQKIADGETQAREARANQQAGFDSMNEIVDIATQLRDSRYLPNVVGPFDVRAPTFLGTSQDVINVATRLKNLLTLDNLDLMTGVLSESDIRILSSAATGLNVTEKGILGSLPGIKAELDRIIEVTNTALTRAKREGKLGGLKGPPGTPGGGAGTTGTGVDYQVVQ